MAAVGVLLLLSHTAQAEDDAHDKLVYGRYSKKLGRSLVKFDLKTQYVELDRPATQKDVEAAKAIFTFEGLGEARVWKLPGREGPIGAQWPALPAPQRNWFGRVCQAEELKVNGKWKRYFGYWLFEEGATVVPAEELELKLLDCPWEPDWHRVADAFWGITRPGLKPGFCKRQGDETPKVGDPLPVELYVDNAISDPLELPATWHKPAERGGPALLDTVSISLQWAPFDPNYPVRRKFIDLKPVRETRFSPDGKKLTVKKGESIRLLALDLRDWFKVEREGYYTVTLKLDWRSRGLRGRVYSTLDCSRNFTIGKEPRLPTIAEFNRTRPALDGQTNEERLKRVIKESVKPRSAERKPLPADVERLLAWSKPVGGLAARIEDVCDWRTTTVLVRLKNTSQPPLVIPTGNPRDKNAPQAFEVYVRQGAGPWRRASWMWDRYCEQSAPDEDQRFAYCAEGVRGLEADRPMVTLQPGEHCLAYVRAYNERDDAQPKEFKVVLRRREVSAEGSWTGVLETPPRLARQTLVQPAALTGALPMPEHLPAFTYASSTGINWSGRESVVEALWHSNRDLFDLLPIYDPADVRKEFERRMRAEKRLAVKLFLAVVAARAGSEEAGLLLLETMKDTDYRTRVNVHGALKRLFPFPANEPPAWVVELSMAALADNRYVTGLEEAKWVAGTAFTVASCAGDLETELCYCKCRKALPLLIERLRKGQSRSYTTLMLGEMGDARAIPVLIELVEAAGKTAKYSKGYGLSEEFSRPAHALSKLKAREAVPLLLRYIEYPEIIADLGDIGDPRAVPILRQVVSARGKITRDGKDVYPDVQQERLFAAKAALAGFDQDNGVARLGEMLSDESLTAHQRYDVVIDLGRRHDPRAIPYLVKVIKTESRYQPADMMENRHYLIDMAICDLGMFKYKAAVERLIECFDVDFKEEELGKGESATPATYRNRIARSLQAITGQPFGADKQQWLKWWQEQGKQSAELK